MEKNNTAFSIDRNGGAVVGQQPYLWNTNLNNANQQRVQISHGDGYYSYKKKIQTFAGKVVAAMVAILRPILLTVIPTFHHGGLVAARQ
ncbi:hypothetical protein D1814_06155 [Alteromonas sp. BL110]|uniref:hypothetical protein n=1 Tax=Alteromonas sp. BL110 TaxID=1714845 RepID=UPI000E4F8D06|nr:hypothetical protein [Alteromonas sp. BL110]AXT38281.1 hypothetical protein D1814_06155 [Alteromonas sp. BL110]RKM83975.1 hypothetical protein D7031_02775 [Alteromonas sp. BL110]